MKRVWVCVWFVGWLKYYTYIPVTHNRVIVSGNDRQGISKFQLNHIMSKLAYNIDHHFHIIHHYTVL